MRNRHVLIAIAVAAVLMLLVGVRLHQLEWERSIVVNTAMENLLPRALLDSVGWAVPRDGVQQGETATLLMDQRTRRAQEGGGTWSELFNAEALHNRFQPFGVVLWALLTCLLGWLTFPLIHFLFPNLRCRGYGLARILGLLIWSYSAWLLASLRLLPYSRAVLWLLLLGLVGLSTWLAIRRQHELRALIKEHGRALLTIDLLFVTLYLFWVGVRWMNPDLWHPTMGGEKPMDFAYLNAVIRSSWFPPYDPWFAGGYLNYYYFGFVMVGSLAKALGIVPSIAYNLAVPSFFALTGVGAYTLASNLADGDRRRSHRTGLWAVFLVLIIGNLGQLQLILDGLYQVGGMQFPSLIPGYQEFVSILVGVWRVVVEGVPLPFRPEWWYWNATRIIPVRPGEVGPINEFPIFTFLYADLHAHMMAMPLTQAAMAIALQWGLGAFRPMSNNHSSRRWWKRWRGLRRSVLPISGGSLLLAGLIGGALRATNTWDYPTYMGLMVAGFLIGQISMSSRSKLAQTVEAPDAAQVVMSMTPTNAQSSYQYRGREETRTLAVRPLLACIITPLLLLICAELLFRPFTRDHQVRYAAFRLWDGSRTPMGVYLVMYGQFLFPIVIGLISRPFLTSRQHLLSRHGNVWPLAGLVLFALVIMALLVSFSVSVAWVAVPLGIFATLVLMHSETSVAHRVLWFWVGTALALSLFVEVAVLIGDIGRMNTVFKFHLQVWMLLGVAAAVFVERLSHRDARFTQPTRTGWRKIGSDASAAAVVLLFCIAALYPITAIPGRLLDRWVPTAPSTLDGMAYLPYAVQYEAETAIPLAADYRVIRWLQENVEGSPTIIESAHADREYLWRSRISVYTGLPTVIGWRWHQVQQRMVMPPGVVEARQDDVRRFYDTEDARHALTILDLYGVTYVILTPYERAYMAPEGLPKFAEMEARGWLSVAYRDDESVVYRVTP